MKISYHAWEKQLSIKQLLLETIYSSYVKQNQGLKMCFLNLNYIVHVSSARELLKEMINPTHKLLTYIDDGGTDGQKTTCKRDAFDIGGDEKVEFAEFDQKTN